MTHASQIRVLVVDDSSTCRRMVSDVVESIDTMELVDAVPNGEMALAALDRAPIDLVLLDAIMPGMDGITVLKRIRSEYPGTSVAIVSGATTESARITVKALVSGALEFIPKPHGEPTDVQAELRKALERVACMLPDARVVESEAAPAPPPRPALPPDRAVIRTLPYKLVMIGLSAGGPQALLRVLPELPADLEAPVVVIQHMPPVFTASLAEYLNEHSALCVKEAESGDRLEPGRVLLAPGGSHLVAGSMPDRACVRMTNAPPVNSCRPSVDVFCESAADAGLLPVLAVILTGMGGDGAAGVERLKQDRCYSLAQSEATCTVYGMPRAVVERGLADEIVDLDQVALRITRIVRRGYREFAAE